MKTLRFGIYAGVLWALVSLVLIAASILTGYRMAWVELDFRTLTCAELLLADALGLASHVSGVAFFAETGLHITPIHVASCLAISFVDGFTSGSIIAIIYNAFAGNKDKSALRKAVYFGLASGIMLGISSGLLAITRTAYGVGITSFEFTVRPVWVTFYLLSRSGMPEFLAALRDSYIHFPKDCAGAFAWAAWGFIDGLIEGAVIAFIYLRLRGNAVK
ncbi:MAG: hypothetical protein ACHQ6U_09005 [Thermodesulfobacteriota bacterium]